MGFVLESSAKELQGKGYQLYWLNVTKNDGLGFHPYPDGYGPMTGEGHQVMQVSAPSPNPTPTLLLPTTGGSGISLWYPCVLQFYAQSVDDPTKRSPTITLTLQN